MGMHKIYDMWPEISQNAFDLDLESVHFDGIDHIVFAGMGGSGAIGDIFSSILSKTSTHVSLVKGYLLPNTVDQNTLVVVTSVSGNTDEALSILKQSSQTNNKTIAFSSGGKIEGFCLENNIEYRKIEQLHSPRASFTNFLYGILKVLGPAIPVKKQDVDDSINELKKLSMKISSENLSKDNPALSLAKWIRDIPLIYYPIGLQSAAIRFKNSIQENSKSHAIAEDVLEACHNGIVAWESKNSVQPILVKGMDDHFKTKERWSILEEFFEKMNVPYWEVNSVEGGILSKIMNLIYLFDYTSIYLAVKNKIDPTPVSSIDFIKSRLNRD